MSEKAESSDSDGPLIDDNVIRIQLRRPTHRKWELRTRNLSPGIKFPTIQLFDSEGTLLVETNEENISIKSSNYDEPSLRSSQSLRERDSKHVIYTHPIRKHNTISGDRVYTRIFKDSGFVDYEKDYDTTTETQNSALNIPDKLTVSRSLDSFNSILDTTPCMSDCDVSSYKSSDNEASDDINKICTKDNLKEYIQQNDETNIPILIEDVDNKVNERENLIPGLHGSQSFSDAVPKHRQREQSDVQRSQSGIIYKQLNKVSFLNTYLKSITARRASNTGFVLNRIQTNDSPQNLHEPTKPSESPKLNSERPCRSSKSDNTTDNEFINIPTDVAADCEMRKRLKLYRRGISEIGVYEDCGYMTGKKRRHSISGLTQIARTSSSESVDEADVILNRLKRRIVKNKLREKRRSVGAKIPGNLFAFEFASVRIKGIPLRFVRLDKDEKPIGASSDECRIAGRGALVRSRLAMGSNISQHSAKGLKGRRARSSGDLCNGETKSQTESSVCGSVVGDVMGWNRSLPNHLDGNRHLADYSRVNNNYGEFATYRGHPKGGRGLRYRISKSGSDAEPVWKLQDPGFDQGYGSERSPEEDYVPPIPPAISLEEYEAELRAIYPFITDDNTFTVVVEKDGRGLGMSVCGGGGLVRIRRLYPPQPAWRTGQLAPRDLLLSANGVPLAGLSTYEALEVLRTAAARVELRVCRPPSDVLESITPPDPPTPPARTPHPPHLPLDPLNCHPLHARLSQTTSSATTSSSEGRGRRDVSPEDRRVDLQLPDLDRPLPVYDIQYGEFDIVMTKVNGSLGFTLRKEDHSALGHYVRALVREPALSDGRIQPGDRIVAVNDTSMSNMSHAEAVAFLRACGSEVRLRLYRDHAATPLSPMSPKEEGPTDSDPPLNKPKPPLRAEAVSMLCDLAARRLTPDAADGSRSPCLSPRKFRKLTKDNNHYEQPNVYLEEAPPADKLIGCTCVAQLNNKKAQAKYKEMNQMIANNADIQDIAPSRPPRKKGAKKSLLEAGKQNSLPADCSNKTDDDTTQDKAICVTKLNDKDLKPLKKSVSIPSDAKLTSEYHSIREDNMITTYLNKFFIENYYENIVHPLSMKFKEAQASNDRLEYENEDKMPAEEPITCTCSEEMKKLHNDKRLSSITQEACKSYSNNIYENVQESKDFPKPKKTIQRSKTQRFTRSHSIRKRLLSKRFKSRTISGPISLEKENETNSGMEAIKSVEHNTPVPPQLVSHKDAKVEDTQKRDFGPERPKSLVIGSEDERFDDMNKQLIQVGNETKLKRPVLTSPTTPPSCRDQKLSLTVIPQNYELNNLDNDTLDAPNAYQEDPRQRYNEPAFPVDSDEPVSMPAELMSTDERFKHSNPAYQSAVLHSSTTDSASDKDDGNGLKKWKGVALSPDNERKVKPLVTDVLPKPVQTEVVQKENIKPEPAEPASTEAPTIVTVELNRGWNSRLGFSVQSHPDSGQSYISAVYNDSVAARDGRLQRGDVILQVNDENVTAMKTPEVIDLLRILRGSICITVLRPSNTQ
ncbi:unnamed protein product [Leptosia nina]|uniref:PDZ domain-containing protein n=1 Tax=Leptosia nina TaxID=320188 RepID=A0AAV1IU86_9NEOP